MTPRRRRRLAFACMLVLGVAAATALVLNAFSESLVYFYTPTEVARGAAPEDRKFRIGGLVKQGSFRRVPDTLKVRFAVTDTDRAVPVIYEGVLPDLFAEGQGIVVDGHLNEAGVFVADRVLAKHDENYMPPEAAAALKRAGVDPDRYGMNGYEAPGSGAR